MIETSCGSEFSPGPVRVCGELKSSSGYSGPGCIGPPPPLPSPPWRMHPSAPSRGHCRPRTHAPAIGAHWGTHKASPGSVVGPPDPNLGLPSTPCGMCMHDRGTPSRGHPRVYSPDPMIRTRTDTHSELPASASGHPDAIPASPRLECHFLCTWHGEAEYGGKCH